MKPNSYIKAKGLCWLHFLSIHHMVKKVSCKIIFQAAEAGKEAAAQAGKMLTKGIGGFAGKAFGSFF